MGTELLAMVDRIMKNHVLTRVTNADNWRILNMEIDAEFEHQRRVYILQSLYGSSCYVLCF